MALPGPQPIHGPFFCHFPSLDTPWEYYQRRDYPGGPRNHPQKIPGVFIGVLVGDITQQGDFTTTGDITGETFHRTSFLVGTTNLLSEIGTKQDEIQDRDLTIAKTSGLQTALDNKYDDTGGTINGNVNITGGLLVGTTNIITELGNKQPTIEDGD